jgi:Nicastrin
MLAAADALRSAQLGNKDARRRIVFLALTGEAWDYTGSRRLLWEMHRGSDATAGLDLDLIDQVCEIARWTLITILSKRASV